MPHPTASPSHPVGRFAPSPTGQAHPGTLLSGLLAWLDARISGARFVLRIEDIDPQRARSEWATQMLDDLTWLGLDWDELVIQTDHADDHANAMDRLADAGRLYGCTCTRSELKRTASLAADGGRRYPGTCRHRVLSQTRWRTFEGAVRYRLDDAPVSVQRTWRGPQVFHPAREMGDPIVRRKDGAMAYNLVVVVDDIRAGVTRVVRGRDLLPSTGLHAAIYQALAAPTPSYWHHPLLLERRDGAEQKLAKLHASIGAETLRAHLSAAEVCGFLAHCVGLTPTPEPLSSCELLERVIDAQLAAVAEHDVLVTWSGTQLVSERP